MLILPASSCPSIEYCNQIQFSNAIACDQGTDFHMDDGDAWEDTVCVSAFDGLLPDEPANLTKFDIIDIGAKLHRSRRDRLKKLKDAQAQSVESMRGALASATASRGKPILGDSTDPAATISPSSASAPGRWDDQVEEPERTRPTARVRPGMDLEGMEEAEEGKGWSGSGGSGYEENEDSKGRLPPRHKHK